MKKPFKILSFIMILFCAVFSVPSFVNAASWVNVPSMNLDVYDVQSDDVVGIAGANSYCATFGGRIPTQAENIAFGALAQSDIIFTFLAGVNYWSSTLYESGPNHSVYLYYDHTDSNYAADDYTFAHTLCFRTEDLSTCDAWTYSTWSSCAVGSQSRTVTTSYPTGCAGGSPVLTQSCIIGTGVVSGDYNCEDITDIAQAGSCQAAQDNITWKNMLLDFGFSIMVLILVFFVIMIFYKIALKPLLNIFKNVR